MATAANALRSTDLSSERGRPRHDRLAVNLLIAMAALLACLTWTAGAWAAAPSNDALDAATAITALPFSDSVDMTDSSLEPSEPQFCYPTTQSIWYAITPTASGMLSASAGGSSWYSQLTVYRQDGAGMSGLSYVGCSDFFGGAKVFEVQAGTTYYLQASRVFGSGGPLEIHVETKLPPVNDDFASATAVASVPFSEDVDLSAASTEEQEPTTCQGLSSPATVWYAFTPPSSGSYVAQSGSPGGTIAAYSGSSVSGLTQIACGSYQTVFHADAGTTYHLQVGGYGGYGNAHFSLSAAPDAQASFYYWPSDPSVFDTVQFQDVSSDIAGIASRSWNLGDGFASTGCCVSHRYAADGTYNAKLDVTTTDGRTASTSQPVPVKTHDVAITALSVPSKGQVGKTKALSVSVNNSRYAEAVQVTIMRSVPGQGFEQVGQVTQNLQARSAKRSTTFNIVYTFDEQDAALGKVTFQAVATILSARDANPADNTVIAPYTKVTR
jgi:hypothetical protein